MRRQQRGEKEGLLNPRAVEALGAWLKENEVVPFRFAVKHGLEPSDFYKLLDGKKDRISVTQAWKIQQGTRGEIKMAMWLPDEKSAGAR